MLETVQYNGTTHPVLARMYAAKLWEDKYGNMAQLQNPESATVTKLLYYVYCCICNGYFYTQEPIPFTFDEMLCNVDTEEAMAMISKLDSLVQKKNTPSKIKKVA
jgi:hypothetical protein